MSFKLMTDNTVDLPIEYLDENNIGVFTLPVQVEDIVYDDFRTIDYKLFFDNMRLGTLPTTSQVNPEAARSGFLRVIEQEKVKDILYLSFSSGMSGTYNSVNMAAKEIMEENPEVKIVVVDTLCASMGEGLLLYKANLYKKQGHSMEETVAYVEKMKRNVVHLVAVDDLFHLCRGGRINKATAIVGSMVNVKPIIHVDNEGHLVNILKVRGRKKSLVKIVEMMGEQMGSFSNQNDVVMVTHGDVDEEAYMVADMVKEKYGVKEVIVNCLGSTIGAHTGPGVVAVFFLGDVR